MPLVIGDILEPEFMELTRDQFAKLVWEDGAKTAGATARRVKKNLQADLSTRAGAKLRDMLKDAIESHSVVQAYARPSKWSKLLISRTELGGGYGLHIDNALMGRDADRVRTDLSFTLFLSDPDSYEGGELVIEQAGQTHKLKANAGDLVIYPSTTLHQVAPVTAGTRYVCVGWIQSQIRSGEQREMLFDLENLRAELRRNYQTNSIEMLTLSKTIANLTRMWAE